MKKSNAFDYTLAIFLTLKFQKIWAVERVLNFAWRSIAKFEMIDERRWRHTFGVTSLKMTNLRKTTFISYVCKGKLVSFSNLSFSNSTNQKYAAHVKKIVYTLVYKLLEAKYVVKSRHTFWRNFYIFENTNGGLIPITKVICTIFVKIVYLNVTQLQV